MEHFFWYFPTNSRCQGPLTHHVGDRSFAWQSFCMSLVRFFCQHSQSQLITHYKLHIPTFLSTGYFLIFIKNNKVWGQTLLSLCSRVHILTLFLVLEKGGLINSLNPSSSYALRTLLLLHSFYLLHLQLLPLYWLMCLSWGA